MFKTSSDSEKLTINTVHVIYHQQSLYMYDTSLSRIWAKNMLGKSIENTGNSEKVHTVLSNISSPTKYSFPTNHFQENIKTTSIAEVSTDQNSRTDSFAESISFLQRHVRKYRPKVHPTSSTIIKVLLHTSSQCTKKSVIS